MAHIGLPPSPWDTYPMIGKYHYHEAGSSHKVTTSLHWIRQLPLMPSQGTTSVFPDLDLHPRQISQNSGSRQAYHRAAAKQLICSSRPAGSSFRAKLENASRFLAGDSHQIPPRESIPVQASLLGMLFRVGAWL